MAATVVSPVAYGIAGAAAPGETSSGDRALVTPTSDGALVAVVDGLGHGPAAEEAALVATGCLEAGDGTDPVALLRGCHTALRRTRGAAVSLASVARDGRCAWLAVGNVQGVVVRRGGGSTRLVARGGVVGGRLPTLRTTTFHLDVGDLLVLCTDGVDDEVGASLRPPASPDVLAQRVHDRHAHGRDDSLVLVAALVGDGS